VSVLSSDPDGWVKPYLSTPSAAPLRRQDKPKVYARNGPTILILRPEMIRSGSLYGGKTMGYRMDNISSLDIDTRDDLKIASALLAMPDHDSTT
jgi:CMP-N-acetylneuraminic acid synthetase